MDSRIEEMTYVISDRCYSMTHQQDVSCMNKDELDRHKTYLRIAVLAIQIRGELALYRDRHPELY